MKRTTKTLFIAALALLAATPVMAGHDREHRNGHGHGYRFEKVLERQERQYTRIERGIESGQLTRKEARRLKKQQRRIRNLAYEFHEDGRLSKRERRILKKKQNRAGERIYAFKHNDAYRKRGYRQYSYWNDENDRSSRYSYAW